MQWLKLLLNKKQKKQKKVIVFQTTEAKESIHVELRLKQFGIPFEVEILKSSLGGHRREYTIRVPKEDLDRTKEILE